MRSKTGKGMWKAVTDGGKKELKDQTDQGGELVFSDQVAKSKHE